MPTGAKEKSITPGELPARPQYFRLPKPGEADPHFGWSRSFYYQAEARGWLKLVRLCDSGKQRGVTLVPYRAVADFIAKQGKAQ
jgi:hypothetical protein